MVRRAERIHIPNLDPKFILDRNSRSNWWVAQFNENISLLNRLAGNLPKSLPWRKRTVEQLKAEVDQLRALGLRMDAYKLAWQDMLDQIQAFGLLSAWRLVELVSSAIWATRRNDPLCAAIMARAALETSASYAWFQTRIRPGIDAVIGKDQFVDFEQLEIEILKTLWASRLEDVEEFYNPTNIVTIIGHITKKIPEQEDVGACYGILCEVAHPNMLGRSLFLSEQDGLTVISRKRGPSATVIEHASLLALSWAAGTLPRSLTAMQATCGRMMEDIDRFTAKVASGWTPPAPR
jgi:hypothetical protein